MQVKSQTNLATRRIRSRFTAILVRCTAYGYLYRVEVLAAAGRASRNTTVLAGTWEEDRTPREPVARQGIFVSMYSDLNGIFYRTCWGRGRGRGRTCGWEMKAQEGSGLYRVCDYDCNFDG